MARVNDDISCVITSVKALAFELGDTTGFESNDLPDFVSMRVTACAPERNINTHVALFGDRDILLVSCSTIFQVNGLLQAYLKDDSDDIDGALLDHGFDRLEAREREAITLNCSVVRAFLHYGRVVES